MQIETKQKEPEFQPVTISITAETPEELNYLWARFNVEEKHVKEAANGKRLPHLTPQMELFTALDKAIKQYQ